MYDAFISYHHAPRDRTLAQRLQKLLEHYPIPKEIRATRQCAHLRVFRDESDFSASANLTQSIQNALENVQFLIFICSPESVKSIWCMAELAYFKKINGGSTENILVLITGGKAPDVFPDILRWSDLPTVQNVQRSKPKKSKRANVTLAQLAMQQAPAQSLHGKHPIEPFAVSVAQEDTKHALKKLNVEFLRFAATLLDCPYDTLRNRAQAYKTKQLCAGFAVALVLLGSFGVYNWNVSQTIQHKNELLEDTVTSLEESNYNLRVKNADILTTAAEIALDDDDRVGAVQNAIAALPTDKTDVLPTSVKAEYILSQASLAYENSKTWLFTPRKTVGQVQGILSARDGKTLVYYDDIGTLYLLDTSTNESKTISLAKGDATQVVTIEAIAIQGEKIYVSLHDAFVCVSLKTGELLWEVATDAGLFGDVANYYFYSGADQILPDPAHGRVAFVSQSAAVVLDDTGAFCAGVIPSDFLNKWAQEVRTDGVEPSLTTLMQDGSLCFIVNTEESSWQSNQWNYQCVVWNPHTQESKMFAVTLPSKGQQLLSTCMAEDMLYLYAKSTSQNANGQKDLVAASVTAYDVKKAQQMWQTEMSQPASGFGFQDESATRIAQAEIEQNGVVVPILSLLTPCDFTVLDATTGVVDSQRSYDEGVEVNGFLASAKGGIWALADRYAYFFSYTSDAQLTRVYTLSDHCSFGVFVSNDILAVGHRSENQVKVYQSYTPNQENYQLNHSKDILQVSKTGLIAGKTQAGGVCVTNPFSAVEMANFTPQITPDQFAFLQDNAYIIADREGNVQLYQEGDGLSKPLPLLGQSAGYQGRVTLYANESSPCFLYTGLKTATFCTVESGQVVVQKQVGVKWCSNFIGLGVQVNDTATHAIVLQQEEKGDVLYRYDIATAQAQKIALAEGMLTPDCIRAMDISADGNTVVVAHAEGFLIVYDMKTQQYQTIDGGVEPLLIKQISLNPSADRLLIWDTNNSVMVYSIVKQSLLGSFDAIEYGYAEDTQYVSDTEVLIAPDFAQVDLYDLNAMQRKATIDGCVGYIPAENVFLAYGNGGIYAYPYYTTQSLIAHGNNFLTMLQGIVE